MEEEKPGVGEGRVHSFFLRASESHRPLPSVSFPLAQTPCPVPKPPGTLLPSAVFSLRSNDICLDFSSPILKKRQKNNSKAGSSIPVAFWGSSKRSGLEGRHLDRKMLREQLWTWAFQIQGPLVLESERSSNPGCALT